MAAEFTWHMVVEGGDVIAAVATSQCTDVLYAMLCHRTLYTESTPPAIALGA